MVITLVAEVLSSATSAGGAGFGVGVGRAVGAAEALADGKAAGAEPVGVWVVRATEAAGDPQPARRRVTPRAAIRP
ncbi:MAG TPA: hypothetical protein VMU20_21700 [Candidatus Dormibacteraeota bacterium]|nr:hypothetical protein [Candidatus Dormibacteraeota bacterium]